MMDDQEQAIAHFCAVTNASTEVAENYLQVADGNVETAVTLYLESGGQGEMQSESRAESGSSSPRLDNALADEEFARQLQREERQRQQPQVRSPIAARHDILAGGGSLFSHTSLWDQGGEAAMIHRSVFNQGDSSSGSPGPDFANALDRRQGAGNGAAGVASTPRTRRLADLYRPPFDIMFSGGFEEARASAREQNKWLLVNVQTLSDFACQTLNRDVWSDATVKEIVRESFVFLQYAGDTPEGKRFTTYYPVKKSPHIAVIDARTGERVKVWEGGGISASDFIMEVTEFLEQGTSDSARLSTMKKKQKTAKNVSDMSEEEQINAAIAASLHGAPSTEKAEEEPTPQAEEEEEEEEEEQPTEKSVLDSIQPIKRDEPTDMANSTRIQLRLPDGKRIIRRFLKTDPVRHLFEFVKAEVPETQSKPFELVFNRKQLIESLDQPIQEAGLVNAAVNFVFT
ncbi:hypothetical protein BJV82DRAFT_409991 [Fennellomyces sp. T-0311]|nr:hypothetical protein BJV82DRAFT_409991 [Fennellomyces sp. T-0311]